MPLWNILRFLSTGFSKNVEEDLIWMSGPLGGSTAVTTLLATHAWVKAAGGDGRKGN